MEDNIKIEEKKYIKDNRNENKNNIFINFIEDNYCYFKQFLPFEDLCKILKLNRRLMSLLLIDKGNKLYNKKKLLEDKLNKIILVSIF